MENDLPTFTDHETRALIYIKQVTEEQSPGEDPPKIAELSERCDWESKYFTRAWKRLEPKGLVDRIQDGRNTRLQLTDKGGKVAEKLLEINQVLEQ